MKIVVIGAGASGLMAASVLCENNHDVTVIEARDRIGGRIHTIRDKFSMPLEAGAEFIHGKQPLTMSLLEQSGAARSLLKGKRYQVWEGRLEKGDLFDDDWEKLTKALKKLEKDTDIASFIEQNFSAERYESLRKKVKGFVEGYDAADLHRVSAMALGEEWSQSDDEHQFHVDGGYSSLMEFLGSRVTDVGGTILLSTPVREIEWKAGSANVKCTTGNALQAEKVVISVPLAVLQNDDVHFSPQPSLHIEAIHKMAVGGVIKFLFEFKDTFWEDRAPRPFSKLAFVFSDAEIPTWWTQRPHEQPILTGWLGGPATDRMARQRESLFQKAIASLSYIFQCREADVENQITRFEIVDWVTDSFARGAYSYPTVNTPKAREILSTPVEDTLYFTGEHLYKGSAPGTVEAALVNGREVADIIAKGKVTRK
jgi:monoamine oxidase